LSLKFILYIKLLLGVFFESVEFFSNNSELFSSCGQFFLGNFEVSFFLSKFNFLGLHNLGFLVIFVDSIQPLANSSYSLGYLTAYAFIEPISSSEEKWLKQFNGFIAD